MNKVQRPFCNTVALICCGAFASILCALPGVTYGYGGGIGPEEYTGAGSSRQATDYKNPLRDRNRPNSYHVTICDDGNWYGAWYPPEWKANSGGVTGNGSQKGQHGYAKQEDGTGGGVQIMGSSVGDTEVTLSKEGGVTLRLRIHVIHCDNSNKGHRGITENTMALPAENSLEKLIEDGQVNVETTGTGETIGHVADLKIENRTDQLINCSIGPMVLESKSGENQDYVYPKTQTAKVDPHGTATVPMDGVCVNRNKPPVAKGVSGELVMNTGDPNTMQNIAFRIPPNQARDLLRIVESENEAVDTAADRGAFDDFPYRGKEKGKEIVKEWLPWIDPRVCQIIGTAPATKEDFREVVDKQAEKQGPITQEKRKRLNQGIDTMFTAIASTAQLAREKEKPAEYAQTEMPAHTFEISDENEISPMPWSGPLPQTKEKPKKEKKKKWPKPVQDWLDKKDAADNADRNKKDAQDNYNDQKKKFFDKSKHHGDLEKARDGAKKKAEAPGATQQDKDNYKDAQKELDKNEKELEKDFNQTPEGKKAADELHDAEKKAQQANDAAKDAEKKLPPGIDKDELQKQHQMEKLKGVEWKY